MPVVRMRLNQAKSLFFDRQKVQNAVSRRERKVLSRFGAYVRQEARSRIRRRKRVSKPDEGPTNQTGLLKQNIFFVYDPHRRSVVIGPTLLNTGTNAPATLEHGGVVTRKTRKGRSKRVVYAPRPYMGPAFQQEKPKLPRLWRDSVR
jgi:hypothetical protein